MKIPAQDTLPKERKKIRAGRHKPRQKDDQVKSMEQLKSAIVSIYYQRKQLISFEECHRNAYYLVKANMSSNLFNMVLNTIAQCLKDLSSERLKTCLGSGTIKAFSKAINDNTYDIFDGQYKEETISYQFLFQLNKVWNIHLTSLPIISSILNVLDQDLQKTSQTQPNLYDTCLEQFWNKVLLAGNGLVRDYLTHSTMKLIELERQGELIDRRLIKDIFNMLHLLGIEHFDHVLVKPFIKCTRHFYQGLNREMISTIEGKSEMLYEVNKRIKEEEDRNNEQMSLIPFKNIRIIILDTIFLSNFQSICQDELTGLPKMLKDLQHNLIKLIYDLIKFTQNEEAFELLKEGMKKFIKDQCTIITTSTSNIKNKSLLANSLVTQLNSLKEKWDNIYLQSLNSDRQFLEASMKCFTLELESIKPLPELLSLYLDDKIKQKDINIESIQDTCLKLFRYIKDKDTFEAFYRQHFAKRLLHQTKPINNFEEEMSFEIRFLNKMELECGTYYSKRIKGMIKDLENNGMLNDKFHSKYSNHSNFKVTLLTYSIWPVSPFPINNLPIVLKKDIETFEKFYKMENESRKLVWCFNLGHIEMKINYLKMKHEVIANVIQFVILDLFNQDTSQDFKLTYKRIKEKITITEVELKKNLTSLSHPKQKILLKSNKLNEIEDSDEFQLNHNFKHPKVKFKLIMPALKFASSTINQDNKADDSAENVSKEIEVSRNHQVDAAIIRIMKMRRRLSHEKLIVEIINQLNKLFTPDIQLIKRRLDSLLEREYLERIQGEANVYHYLA